jgi:5-formyltetrahydrofolate cyclo-ligase
MTEPPSKAQLRAEAAARREAAHAADPTAGERLAALLPPALWPANGAMVSGYWPFRSEIDPRPLMHALAEAGARLALPVTPAKGSDQPLSFRLWDAAHTLAPGHFGVHEPPAQAQAVEPDLVLVPLLAFDRTGHRLGYGAGHYDRTLARLRRLKPVVALGLAYAAQAVETLPAGPYDQKLDGVLTERAYIPFRKDT